MARQVELALISQASWAFFVCHSQLKWCFQKGHIWLSAKWSPLQLMHLKVWGHSLPCLVSNLGGLVLGLALQHQAISLWRSGLCGPLHFWHPEPWALHEKVEWLHFQQLWHCRMLGFILVPLIVAMYWQKLKEWLISSLALEPFWESQTSSHTIAMSDLGNALMTLGFEASETVSNRVECLIELTISSWVSLLPLGWINGMPVILR